MMKRSGEMGDPWGTPTWTAVGVLGDPLNRRVMYLSDRNEQTQFVRYFGTCFCARIVHQELKFELKI